VVIQGHWNILIMTNNSHHFQDTVTKTSEITSFTYLSLIYCFAHISCKLLLKYFILQNNPIVKIA